MNLKELVRERPHLEETLKLYEKVLKFNTTIGKVLDTPGHEDRSYPASLVGPVVADFSSIFGIPEENLLPLKEVMMAGRVDFTRLPLNELPSFSLPYHEDELGLILFIISKPFFIRLGETFRPTETYWEEGRCPVCDAKPSLGSLESEERRVLYCSFCDTAGPYRRLGCPLCSTGDTSKITVFTFEGETDFRVDACDACGSYIKLVVHRGFLDKGLSPDLADLLSIPLDVVAQRKGYRRHSPNPIGMIRIA